MTNTTAIRQEKTSSALLCAIFVLLAAAIITFPFAFNITWAMPTVADRTLTYEPGQLTWDNTEEIDAQTGIMHLPIFSTSYKDSASSASDNIVAPKTEKSTLVNLLNTANNQIEYTAVLYRTDASSVPLNATITTGTDTSDYVLPNGVTQEQVVSAKQGTLASTSTENIEIYWKWDGTASSDSSNTNATANASEGTSASAGANTSTVAASAASGAAASAAGATQTQAAGVNGTQGTASATQDAADTVHGNASALEEVGLGFYVTVSDATYDPSANIFPKTGDNTNLKIIFAICVIALIALLVLFITRRKNNNNNASASADASAGASARASHATHAEHATRAEHCAHANGSEHKQSTTKRKSK